jgi:hypothetical protein
MLKSGGTINGILLLFSLLATAKHYATCQLIHGSHLIFRYIIIWIDAFAFKFCVHDFSCFHEYPFVSVCGVIASRTFISYRLALHRFSSLF